MLKVNKLNLKWKIKHTHTRNNHNNSRLISPIIQERKKETWKAARRLTQMLLPVEERKKKIKIVPRAERSTPQQSEPILYMFWSRTVHSDLWTLKRAQLVCLFQFDIFSLSFFALYVFFWTIIFHTTCEHHYLFL